MGEKSGIAWTDATFNPWIGCTKVSPACTNCYAEAFDHRMGGSHWGVDAVRRVTSDANWKQPLKWNRDAQAAGVRKRVFCASLADVFEDRSDLEAPRARLWKLIAATPWLDWLMLTKRPENFATMVPWMVDGSSPWPNVWLGTTIEDQKHAALRLPYLIHARAVVRWVSAEPLLGPLNLALWIDELDWIITGCESGARARQQNLGDFRALRDQCAAYGKAYFLKQAEEANVVTRTGIAPGGRAAARPRETRRWEGAPRAAVPRRRAARELADAEAAPVAGGVRRRVGDRRDLARRLLVRRGRVLLLRARHAHRDRRDTRPAQAAVKLTAAHVGGRLVVS